MTCPEKEDSKGPICLVQSYCPVDSLATQIYIMLELELELELQLELERQEMV